MCISKIISSNPKKNHMITRSGARWPRHWDIMRNLIKKMVKPHQYCSFFTRSFDYSTLIFLRFSLSFCMCVCVFSSLQPGTQHTSAINYFHTIDTLNDQLTEPLCKWIKFNKRMRSVCNRIWHWSSISCLTRCKPCQAYWPIAILRSFFFWSSSNITCLKQLTRFL